MKFFMERDEIPCVLLFAVKIVCFFGLKALDEYQFVRIVGACEKVVCDTAGLISGQCLNRRCNADDLVAGPGLQLDGNQKFVHGIFQLNYRQDDLRNQCLLADSRPMSAIDHEDAAAG